MTNPEVQAADPKPEEYCLVRLPKAVADLQAKSALVYTSTDTQTVTPRSILVRDCYAAALSESEAVERLALAMLEGQGCMSAREWAQRDIRILFPEHPANG